jgi:hypothetical protein
MRTYNAADFGYKEDSMLMHVTTGSVATAQEWAEEAHTWFPYVEDVSEKQLDSMICETFGELVDVEWDIEEKTWKEKEI